MSDLSYIIGYALLFLLNAQTVSAWLASPVAHREEAFFGLRVSPEVLAGPGRRILGRYRLWLVTAFVGFEVLNLLVPIYLGKVSYLLFLRAASNVLLPALAITLFGVFQERVKAFETPLPQEPTARIVLSLRPRRLRDYTNVPFEIANAFILVASVLLLIYCYPSLPERLPTHISWSGVIDGWWPKRVSTVFGGLIWLLYLQVGILLLKSAIVQSPRSLPPRHTEEHLEYSEKLLRLVANFLDWARFVWVYSITLGDFNLLVLRADRVKLAAAGAVRVSTLGIVINVVCQLGFWILATVPTCYYLYRMYVLDCKLRPAESGVLPRPADPTHFSLGGVIYFNPDNPAWLVTGPRWHAINLANKWVYICAAYLAGIVLLAAWAPELL